MTRYVARACDVPGGVMKLFALALAVSLLAISVPAAPPDQVDRSRSTSFDLASGKYSVAYIHDGEQGSAGIVFNDLGIPLPSDRLKLSALYVNTTGSAPRSYIGTYLSYRAIEQKGFTLDLGVGLKGLDVTSLLASSANASGFRFDSRQLVFGVGVTIPLK